MVAEGNVDRIEIAVDLKAGSPPSRPMPLPFTPPNGSAVNGYDTAP